MASDPYIAWTRISKQNLYIALYCAKIYALYSFLCPCDPTKVNDIPAWLIQVDLVPNSVLNIGYSPSSSICTPLVFTLQKTDLQCIAANSSNKLTQSFLQNGGTPLLYAVRGNHMKCVEALLGRFIFML